MTLIGENIHIISKTIKEAIAGRDEAFVLNLVQKQLEAGISTLDLNIGPAKAGLEGAMAWLVALVSKNFPQVNFSLDTTSAKELKEGFSLLKNPKNCFLNSATADETRLFGTVDIAKQYNANLVALTLDSSSGIPKTSDERLELAFRIIEKTTEAGIDNSKIYFDPLVLPVCVEQGQPGIALEAIRMFKESFDPEVKTVVGLSNVSNGVPQENRPLINRVFFALALGAGLDAAIIDSFDTETVALYNLLRGGKAETPVEKLYFDLYNMSNTLSGLEDVEFDSKNPTCVSIYKVAKILLNKEIYSHSFLENN